MLSMICWVRYFLKQNVHGVQTTHIPTPRVGWWMVGWNRHIRRVVPVESLRHIGLNWGIVDHPPAGVGRLTLRLGCLVWPCTSLAGCRLRLRWVRRPTHLVSLSLSIGILVRHVFWKKIHSKALGNTERRVGVVRDTVIAMRNRVHFYTYYTVYGFYISSSLLVPKKGIFAHLLNKEDRRCTLVLV
jgi:hypothetical protein